jgi:GT2 family glycosyltransferase
VASSIKPKQAGNQAGMGPKALNFLGCPVSGFFETSETVFYPEGCAFLFPPLLLPEGPFDPDYFISQEDVYLGWKFRLRGRRVYQAPGSKVFHEGEGTVGKFPKWKAVFYQARNRWINLLVFYEKTNLFKISPWLLMDTLSRWMKGLLMDWPSVWGITLAFFWIAAHPGAILQKRLAVQKKRKVQDREILQYMSGRVMRDHGAISRIFNFLSLAYCRLFFLRVMEFKPE